jgi:hypothetical protein
MSFDKNKSSQNMENAIEKRLSQIGQMIDTVGAASFVGKRTPTKEESIDIIAAKLMAADKTMTEEAALKEAEEIYSETLHPATGGLRRILQASPPILRTAIEIADAKFPAGKNAKVANAIAVALNAAANTKIATGGSGLYQIKYLKYKTKYLALKKEAGME